MWLQHPYHHSTSRIRRWRRRRPLSSALLPAPDSRRRQQLFLSKPSRSPARSPRTIPPLLSAAARSFSALPWEQQYHFLFERQQIIVFLGWEREAADGQTDGGGDNGVNEGSGGSCVILRRRTGSELGALARPLAHRDAFNFFFSFSVHLSSSSSSSLLLFHLSHFFERIGWWRRNR